jgi:organic hydroperoxide reductase OsmC/OhrA
MNVVYSTTVSSVGGRDGTIRNDDGTDQSQTYA